MLDVKDRRALICILVLSSIGACSPASSHDKHVVEARQPAAESLSSAPLDMPEPPPPILSVIVGRGANPFDNPGGVTFAVWPDGRVMRSGFHDRVTNWIVQGRLSDAQLAQVKKSTAMLREHEESKGQFCCSHQSIKVANGSDRGTYTHQLVKGRSSQPISDFIDALWQLEIADGVRASGVTHGRFPHSGLKDIYPRL